MLQSIDSSLDHRQFKVQSFIVYPVQFSIREEVGEALYTTSYFDQ